MESQAQLGNSGDSPIGVEMMPGQHRSPLTCPSNITARRRGKQMSGRRAEFLVTGGAGFIGVPLSWVSNHLGCSNVVTRTLPHRRRGSTTCMP